MDYRQPPWGGYPTSSPPSWPQHQPHGSDGLFLGAALGELKSGQSQIVTAISEQTHVLQEIRGQLASNATLMSERLPARPAQTIDDRLRTMREILKTLVPLALLAAIVTGKLTWLEAWPLLRASLGLAG